MAAVFCQVGTAFAHDSWVQANTNLERLGNPVHIGLMLGNHGNEHRDFKLAGKVDLAHSSLQLIDPTGKLHDIKTRLVDNGHQPNEGYWGTLFTGSKPGLYMAVHTFDKVMSYAPVRDIKSAKTFFVVSRSLDRVPRAQSGFNRRLGHALELVPEADPVTSVAPRRSLAVRLYFKGRPLAGTRVSFIPQGETLKPGFDARFERTTNANGRASFTPHKPGYYLVAAHRKEPGEKGAGYEGVNYSATLTLLVPQVCVGCGG